MSARTASSFNSKAPPGKPTLSPLEFWQKWHNVSLGERQASQQHFLDLCRVAGEKTPQEADPKGTKFCFEKGAEKLDGKNGWADVWKKERFAWEYKGPHKDLKAAYEQLLQYRESLENPPLLVVCNLKELEVHTNFTNTTKQVHRLTIDDFRDRPDEVLRVLHALFREPDVLKPGVSREQLTEDAAGRFADLAGRLQKRGFDPLEVARFLTRLLFCFFAEDTEVLPKGLLKRTLKSVHDTPDDAAPRLSQLFQLMATDGPDRYFGTERVDWFNGGLFTDDHALPLRRHDIDLLLEVAEKDWSNIEPAILGTLFERGLDPDKRSQLGAHYTAIHDIMRVVEPVVLTPLRREFEELKTRLKALRTKAKGKAGGARTKAQNEGRQLYRAFQQRLRTLRVLDPACGSGNFLYVVLKELKSLEKEAILWAAEELHIPIELPQVGPEVVHGIELNPYAAELARVTVWIGELQWMIANGFGYAKNPILRRLDTIECRDAILDRTGSGEPIPAAWPDAEFIVGNPPFLGRAFLRGQLGEQYVDALFQSWEGMVPHEADLVVYWHEKARQLIGAKRAKRAGLLATQGIRFGANRRVLEKIKESGDIFLAWSDEPWVVDGASVRTSIICQDNGSETSRELDGKPVEVIFADLKGGQSNSADLTKARRLQENRGLSFIGDQKTGKFDLTRAAAESLLKAPTNPNGRTNHDVIRPWVNGLDVTRRPRDCYIIDFGNWMELEEAAKYEKPFEHVRTYIYPKRKNRSRKAVREFWWIHEETRPGMRAAVSHLRRFIVTPRNGRQRVFRWLCPPVLPDCQVVVIAREDWYSFGVLQSRIHELWSLGMCSWLGVGNDPRYTPRTTFETFPFPWPLSTLDKDLTTVQRAQKDAIAKAAESLDVQRERWLNPTNLVRDTAPLAPGFPVVKAPVDATAAKELKRRTLTALYHEPPTWLVNAHRELDEAVMAAYGWSADSSDSELLERLLHLNLERPERIADIEPEEDESVGADDEDEE